MKTYHLRLQLRTYLLSEPGAYTHYESNTRPSVAECCKQQAKRRCSLRSGATNLVLLVCLDMIYLKGKDGRNTDRGEEVVRAG